MEASSRADVERLLLERRGGATGSIPRLEEAETAPLSFAQERMWLLDRMLPNVSAYNVPRLWSVHGRLDQTALQNALETVSARHSALRTGISLVDGAPVQEVHANRIIELAVHDLRDRPDADALAETIVSELAWRRFDLERDPMLRVALFHHDAADRLLLVSHHLVSDHGSGRILLTELTEAYEAALAGRRPCLPELTIQYADFAAWQRKEVSGPRLDELISYWRRQLEGAPDRLDLPSDRSRPPAKTYSGAERRAILPADLVTRLRALARDSNISFYTVLLTGFYALLHRYTGTEDIVIGTPISGRHHEETQPLIGYFSNTLALRTKVEEELTFGELLKRVRTTAVEAFAHQELPFERLVEMLNPTRDPSHTPVFQVLFTHDHAPASMAFDGMQLEPVGLANWPWSRFDLAVGTHERHDGRIDVVVEYSADLFESETIDRLIGHFAILLEGAVANLDLPVGMLPLLTDSERQLVLEDWNSTDRPVETLCVHELVAAQAATTPDRTAIEGSGRSITYRELDERTNRLAHHLRGLGVSAGSLVGVCLDRVPETLLAILGVLKAGAAYVPVEPTYPRDRQAFMLADAAVPVIITQESLLHSLPEHAARSVCLDRDWDEIAAEPGTAPSDGARPDDLAYVIYTSGSTGQPKGVEIRHRSIVNLLTAMRERPGLTDEDVVVNVTTPAFDLSVPDLYLPLVCGARLVIVPRERTQDPARLAEALEDAGATFMQATPTTWRLLVDAGWEGREGLKIVCGGEPLPRSLANELLDRGSGLWHMYGPTETTVWSSALKLERGHGAPPIGGPIANTRFYLVDQRQHPVPIGVPGELMIGGAGVARGYRNRPDLTTEMFVDDPFAPGRGNVYRTGDRMRLRSDGTLEFLGRLDYQVKLHGYRIELGEIESALDAHEDVRQSVAIIHEDEPGERRLIAYVVPEPDREPVSEDLRRHLADFVPAYAVPTTIVRLNALPHTANGKLDTKALPRPGVVRADLDVPYVAPRTPTEEAVAALWSELLPIDKVGADDNFFELGGHSLLAVKMLARLHDRFAVEIFLTDVFERPTLAELAAAVSDRVLTDAVGDNELARLLSELEGETGSAHVPG